MTAKDKTVVITGANSGIGLHAGMILAGQGARIVMACRSMNKAQDARDEILQAVPNADVVILPLDVSEIDSVKEFVRLFAEQIGELDILINNAGVVMRDLKRNSKGYEMHMATNYLGAFALTGLLLPYFKKSVPTRIVNVGSLAHRFGKVDFDDPNWERTQYSMWKGYARSKIATAGFTQELNHRLALCGSNTIALGAHPGFAATDVGKKNGAAVPRTRFGQWYQDTMEKLVVGKVDDAALHIVFAAVGEGVSGGDYYGPTGLFEIKGKTGKAKLNPLANDLEFCRRLWAMSEELTDVRFLSVAAFDSFEPAKPLLEAVDS